MPTIAEPAYARFAACFVCISAMPTYATSAHPSTAALTLAPILIRRIHSGLSGAST
jgi:hypothetical protein